MGRIGRQLGVTAAILLAVGCAGLQQPVPQECPGKETVQEALATLHAHAEKVGPFKASGQCLLRFATPDGSEARHNLPLRLWFNPPVEIYVQASAGLDGRAIFAGANDYEFWLGLRPGEISTYYWGKWSDFGDRNDDLFLSPRTVLEALGIVIAETRAGEVWTLERKDLLDVLEQRTSTGSLVKRAYVETCDYRVRQVEYFGPAGQLTAVASLNRYKTIGGSGRLPTVIHIDRYSQDVIRESLHITLESLTPTQFNEQQRQRLFVRPEPRGFESVLENVNGRWVRRNPSR